MPGARQARADTIFTVEREAAALREGRAMTNVGLLLGLIAVVLVAQFYVLPSVDTSALVEATTTPTLAISTPTPRPTLAPTLSVAEVEQTRTRVVPMPTATAAPTATPNVTPTPYTPAAACIAMRRPERLHQLAGQQRGACAGWWLFAAPHRIRTFSSTR